MIPGIDSILEEFLCSAQTAEDFGKALRLIEAHLRHARNENDITKLRDHFAGLAMQGLLPRVDVSAIATSAYSVADDMLAVRTRKGGAV